MDELDSYQRILVHALTAEVRCAELQLQRILSVWLVIK